MQGLLEPHPGSPSPAVRRIEVVAERPRPHLLLLRFRMTGQIADLAIPSQAEPLRTDELWRRSCFEAFVRARGSEAYYEFNLSPSTQWAAYRFDGYREGMRSVEAWAAPSIETSLGAETFELSATLDLGPLTDLPEARPWRVGFSAVIQDLAGGTSYWALAHPPGRPDFHHADCFAGEVVAPHGP